MKTVNSAGIIIYRQTLEGPKFLLLYHGHNYWNFPKGKMEENERVIQTALREVQEETGLKNAEIKLKKNFKNKERFSFKDRVNKDQIFKVVTFYLAETKQPVIKISKEHQGYGWFLYPEAKRILNRYKNTQDIITKAFNLIKKEGGVPVQKRTYHKNPKKEYKPKIKNNLPKDGKI